ncbi:MAG: hypothetical protein ACRC8W_21390 [Plesiomonas shigelloides]
MAHYSYKDVCYQIPSHIEERFKEENGRDPDGDPNYDGDYWSLTAMWIEELENKIASLERENTLLDEMLSK